MNRSLPAALTLLVLGALAPERASADYASHPELHPSVRCGAKFQSLGGQFLDCQRMIWDLPAPSHVGFRAVAAEFAEDPIPRFGRGLTDRIPPLYVEDLDNDGKLTMGDYVDLTITPKGVVGGAKGFEQQDVGGTRLAMCPVGMDLAAQGTGGDPYATVDPADKGVADPNLVPWWAPVLGTDGQQISADDPLGVLTEAPRRGQPPSGDPQHGKLFEVQCRRGSRVTYGPWVSGESPDVIDYIGEGMIKFENTDRLTQIDGLSEDDSNPEPRVEWNVGTEIYNHFGSHHGTCWQPTGGPAETCNDPLNPLPAKEYRPGGACYAGYTRKAEEGGDCNPEGKVKPNCPGYENFNQQFRNATQIPGRLFVSLPPGLAAPTVEDQVWACDHHTQAKVSGLYDLPRQTQFWKQQEFFTTQSGAKRGGVVGEIIFQLFTEEFAANDYKIPSVMFEVVQDFATTWYPPFTFNVHETIWYAPFDSAVGLITTHSHHRTVKSTVDILPVNPPRLNSPDPECGGSAGGVPTNLFVNWDSGDAKVCEYWKEPDGPLIVRKGQAVRTVCYVNNGVTPEAIKNGLVAGAAVEGLRNAMTEEGEDPIIPRFPEGVPVESWGPTLETSPLGTQLLYGVHDPDNYRVKYSCGPAPGFSFDPPLNDGSTICPPNPAVDGDGDYVDGPYENYERCGTDTDNDGIKDRPGWCNPSTIVFANVGEDEMCIPVFMYWALDRVLKSDGSVNQEVVDRLTGAVESGDPNEILDAVDETGTPGRVWKSPSDRGSCTDGTYSNQGAEPGIHIAGPDSLLSDSSYCRAGL